MHRVYTFQNQPIKFQNFLYSDLLRLMEAMHHYFASKATSRFVDWKEIGE